MTKEQIFNILLEAKKELDFFTDEEIEKKGYNKEYYKPIIKKYKKEKEFKRFLKKINKKIYDFNEKELDQLGFRVFENKLYLVPLWLFRLLPKKTKLISIFDKKTMKKNANDVIRFKCVSYGFKIRKQNESSFKMKKI